MSSLSPEEREAIDAAIREGRVQTVPKGRRAPRDDEQKKRMATSDGVRAPKGKQNRTPYAPPTFWDGGPVTLAHLTSDIDELRDSFHLWLQSNPKRRNLRKIGKLEDGSPIFEAEDVMLARLAAEFLSTFEAQRILEPAEWTDPETGKKVNPNGVQRVRKLSMCALYEKQGRLTKRQAMAAEAVLFAWERNQRTPPAVKKVQVDVSSKPDQHIAILIDRVSAFSWVMRRVPDRYRKLVKFVCAEDNRIKDWPGYKDRIHMIALRDALDELADGIGLKKKKD